MAAACSGTATVAVYDLFHLFHQDAVTYLFTQRWLESGTSTFFTPCLFIMTLARSFSDAATIFLINHCENPPSSALNISAQGRSLL